MHPIILKSQADERIAQFHREAEQARLLKAAKEGAQENRRIGVFELRVLRRAAAAVALSVVFILGGSVALASPMDAGRQTGDVHGKRSSTEICLPKRAPEGVVCTNAGTGVVTSVSRDVGSPSESPPTGSGIEIDVEAIGAVTTVALLGAGAAMALRRRVASA